MKQASYFDSSARKVEKLLGMAIARLPSAPSRRHTCEARRANCGFVGRRRLLILCAFSSQPFELTLLTIYFSLVLLDL